MRLPTLQIGDLTAIKPIIQGGMGIGVSRAGLAAAVANQGGVGVLSGVQMGFMEHDFKEHPLQANIRAMVAEIRKARKLAPNGIIGINFLVAMSHYNEMVKAAVEEGIDLIISGAGIPATLPKLVQGFKTKIAPIVSSGRVAQVIAKLWEKHYDRVPDLVIVEGPKAGGHLGFTAQELHGGILPSLNDITKDVMQAIAPYAERAKIQIPVIAAGGIFTGADIAGYIRMGACGVQIATRFVVTEECDADIRYKEAYLNAREEDVTIIDSPVGMPGRALNNKFIQSINEKAKPGVRCSQCIKGCNPKVAPYCISEALINAVKGEVDDGLVFVGGNVGRLHKIVSVKALMEELTQEAQLALE